MHESYHIISLWHCVRQLCPQVAAACNTQQEQCEQDANNLWPDALLRLMSWTRGVEVCFSGFPCLFLVFPHLSSLSFLFFPIAVSSRAYVLYFSLSVSITSGHHSEVLTTTTVTRGIWLLDSIPARYTFISVRELCATSNLKITAGRPTWDTQTHFDDPYTTCTKSYYCLCFHSQILIPKYSVLLLLIIMICNKKAR